MTLLSCVQSCSTYEDKENTSVGSNKSCEIITSHGARLIIADSWEGMIEMLVYIRSSYLHRVIATRYYTE